VFASLCLAMWCAIGAPPEGQVYPPPFTLSLAQDVYSKNEFTERIILGEQYRIFAGVVSGQHNLTPIVGYFPLEIGYRVVKVSGGVSAATSPVPVRGTKFNWVARARISLAPHLGIEWWHLSNARSAIPNPSLDAVAIAFSW